MSDNIPTPPPAGPLPNGVEEAFRGQYQALNARHRKLVAERDDRARTHIKAVIEALKETTSTPAAAVPQVFISGMLTGLVSSVEILDGGTAEKALESVNTRLAAAIGEAYLAGNLPTQPPATVTPDQEIRGVQGSMALDLHQALGLAVDPQAEHQGHASWADWWADLCSRVTQRTQAERAHARARVTSADLTASSFYDWHAFRQELRPEPEDLFFPISYGAVLAEAHPAAPTDPPYMIDLTGYTSGEPLRERARRLIVHRSLITALVRDLAALEQPVTEVPTGQYPGPAAARKLLDSQEADIGRLTEERDGAYRERTRLEALLAAMTDGAVVAPAADVDEPGWQILFLTIGGRQATWHVSPRDADLVAGIEHVAVDDPRAQWDGHSTDAKYAHIAAYAAELLQRCGPACAEAHTYTGRCEGAPATEQVDYPGEQAPDLVHSEPTPQVNEPDQVDEPCAQHPTAPVIGGMCGSCTVYPVTKE